MNIGGPHDLLPQHNGDNEVPWDVLLQARLKAVVQLKADEPTRMKSLEQCYRDINARFSHQGKIHASREKGRSILSRLLRRIRKRTASTRAEGNDEVSEMLGTTGHDQFRNKIMAHEHQLMTYLQTTIKYARPLYDDIDNDRVDAIAVLSVDVKDRDEVNLPFENSLDKCLCILGHSLGRLGFSGDAALYPDLLCGCNCGSQTEQDLIMLKEATQTLDTLDEDVAIGLLHEWRLNNWLVKNNDGIDEPTVGEGLHPAPLIDYMLCKTSSRNLFPDYQHGGARIRHRWKKFMIQNSPATVTSQDQLVITRDGLAVRSGQRLLAISHVWSNIDNTFETIMSHKDTWLDEFGAEAIWWDPIATPESHEARRQMIKEMANIYHSSVATVVILGNEDMEKLKRLWYEHGVHPRNGLRVTNWARRMWTYQEELLSTALFLWLETGFCNLRGHTTTGTILGFTSDYFDFANPKSLSLTHCIMMCSNRRLSYEADYYDCFEAVSFKEEDRPVPTKINSGVLSLLREADGPEIATHQRANNRTDMWEISDTPCWRPRHPPKLACYWGREEYICYNGLLQLHSYMQCVESDTGVPSLRDKDTQNMMTLCVPTENRDILVTMVKGPTSIWHIVGAKATDRSVECRTIKKDIAIGMFSTYAHIRGEQNYGYERRRFS
ncbi:unnamed protein product [Umbelopsis ramanniana]